MSDQDNDQRIGLWIVFGVVTAVVTSILWSVLPSPNASPASAEKPAVAAAATPAASLGALAMVYAGGKLTITGDVPDEKSKERLLKPARLLFGAENIVDQITVKEGVPGFWWKTKPLDVFAKLKNLASFSLDLGNNEIKLVGATGTDSAKANIESALPSLFIDDAKINSDIKVDSTLGGLNLDASVLLNESIEFASGAFALPESAKKRLAEIADLLKEDGRKIKILGHTDNQGDAALNASLSEKRAQSVRDFLVSKGVAADNLEAIGYGADKPAADNATPEGRQRNRRIEFAQ